MIEKAGNLAYNRRRVHRRLLNVYGGNMKNIKRRTVSCIIVFLLLFAVLPFCVRADTKKEALSHKVRVGWYNSDHFQEGDGETSQKSGYSYEYLQSVSNYTGWEYEYVSGGWSELYDAFLKGYIDLLAGVSYTEELSSLMNYPSYEMGFESYYIYKKAGNDAILGSDLSTLAGKRIGTLENNLMTTFFEAWMEETGADCKEVLFDDFTVRDQAFEDGKIDAVIAVNNNVPSNSGYTPVVMVGESDPRQDGFACGAESGADDDQREQPIFYPKPSN